MKARGERIVIFGDSLSHPGSDNGPTQSIVTLGSDRTSSAPGDLMGSLLLEQGAEAVMIDARVGRSAANYWTNRENSSELMASIAAFKPTKAVVMLGTNDIGRNELVEKTGLEAIRDALARMGAEVWAIGPMSYVGRGANLNNGAEEVFKIMSEVFKPRLIDARPLSSQANRAGDGIHFSATSARETAQALTEALLAKNPAPSWIAYALGAAGVLGGFALIWSLVKRSRRGLSGNLMLPPEPEASDEEIMQIAADARTEGDDERADLVLKQLSKEGKKLLVEAVHVQERQGEEDADDAPDSIIEAIETLGPDASVDEVIAKVQEDIDDYRETWIEQQEEIEDRAQGPAVWEAWRNGWLGRARTIAERRLQEQREEVEAEKRDAETMSFDGPKETSFQDLIRDEEPGAMQIAEDYLLEKGWKLRQVTGGMHAKNFTIELSPMWKPKDEWKMVQVNVYDPPGSSFDYRAKFSVANGSARAMKETALVARNSTDARREAVAMAWEIAKKIKSRPMSTTEAHIEQIVEAVIYKGAKNIKIDELYGLSPTT